jgi:hypothetical protein
VATKLLVSRSEAADMLGVSIDTFERRVMPDLRVTRIGARVLVPVASLERWIERNSARPLSADLAKVHR